MAKGEEGLKRANAIEQYKVNIYNSELSTYTEEGMYINKIGNDIFYDPNLKHIDEYILKLYMCHERVSYYY